MLGLAKHTHGAVEGVGHVRLLKVLAPAEAAITSLNSSDVLLWDEDRSEGASGPTIVRNLKNPEVVRPGDVIRLRPNSTQVSVLYRRGSPANVLFATERCNSLCLMCSQPPRDEDDAWRLEELISLVRLIDRDEPQIGITGGEPTLLGDGLVAVLEACAAHLPDTHIHTLTNGRRFADPRLARALVEAGGKRTVWAVPLAGDHPAQHDEIMGSPGGFSETMAGLAQLAAQGARVEIRVVLHALSVPRLPQLAQFIYRRLPFVQHVALMGMEPMGFAKVNRDRLWIDPTDYVEQLRAAVQFLADRGLATSIYNLPLCVLPAGLWPFARQSISDWKNAYPAECTKCTVRERCSGFFASAGAAWRSRAISPVPQSEPAHEVA